MECPKCYQQIPSFILSDYLKSKKRCPSCYSYCSSKTARTAMDKFAEEDEDYRYYAKADRKERRR